MFTNLMNNTELHIGQFLVNGYNEQLQNVREQLTNRSRSGKEEFMKSLFLYHVNKLLINVYKNK